MNLFNEELQNWANRYDIHTDAQFELNNILLAPTITSTDEKELLPETENMAAIRLVAPKNGSLLWRNNVGAFFNEHGRLVRTGLANSSKRANKKSKSSDLIGITNITRGSQAFGVFTAIEVKKSGWKYAGKGVGKLAEKERAQLAYIILVQKYGGIAGFAASVQDFVVIIQRYCGQ